jgi:hypothetical protein
VRQRREGLGELVGIALQLQDMQLDPLRPRRGFGFSQRGGRHGTVAWSEKEKADAGGLGHGPLEELQPLPR